MSYSAQVSPDEYAKGGSSAVIDFKNNDVNLYPHVGAGKGYSEGVSFSVGLVNNYEKPEDYAGHFVDVNVGKNIGGRPLLESI